MSLEGSLASFGLPDVLSLLAMTNKTGHLRLSREGGDIHGTVVLKDGVVVAAASDDSDNTLARRFIAAGLIDRVALEQALAASGSGELAEALAGAADLAPSAVEELAREQVLDAVFDLLGWGDGDFGFDVCDVSSARTHTEVAATAVVAEAQRRLTSLQELTDRLPEPSTVLALPVIAADDRPVGAAEWAAMALVDGRRTLGEAVGLSDRGAWQTLSVFAGLIERGLLVEASDQRSVVYRASLMSMLQNPVEVASAGVSAFAVSPVVGPPVVGPPVSVAPTAFAAAPVAPVSAFESPAPVEPLVVTPVLVEEPVAVEPTAASVAALEVAAPEPADDGIDDALLQQLMAGARAL